MTNYCVQLGFCHFGLPPVIYMPARNELDAVGKVYGLLRSRYKHYSEPSSVWVCGHEPGFVPARRAS